MLSQCINYRSAFPASLCCLRKHVTCQVSLPSAGSWLRDFGQLFSASLQLFIIDAIIHTGILALGYMILWKNEWLQSHVLHVAWRPCSTSTSFLTILQVHSTSPQTFVDYTLVLALPFEMHKDQDIIHTLRLQSGVLLATLTFITHTPSSISETAIKVPEYRQTVGRCHDQIHASSHHFSLDIQSCEISRQTGDVLRQYQGISVILFNHWTDEISIVVLGRDRFASGICGYPIISTFHCVAKWWEVWG